MDYKNIESISAVIISSGKATLRELNEYYTLEEGMKLYAIILTDRYNEYLAIEYAKKKAKENSR